MIQPQLNMAEPTQIQKDTVTVYVGNPEKVLFEGEAVAVSSKNEKGPFDVLLQHENFICTVQEKVIIHLKGGGKKEIPISKGILKVEVNSINIFLGIEGIR